jgi:hypothetical protein
VLVEQSSSENEIDMSRRSAWLRSPLWVYLLIALLLRIWLIVHTRGVIDGDEAVVGIQAEHILRGVRCRTTVDGFFLNSPSCTFALLAFAMTHSNDVVEVPSRHQTSSRNF